MSTSLKKCTNEGEIIGSPKEKIYIKKQLAMSTIEVKLFFVSWSDKSCGNGIWFFLSSFASPTTSRVASLCTTHVSKSS